MYEKRHVRIIWFFVILGKKRKKISGYDKVEKVRKIENEELMGKNLLSQDLEQYSTSSKKKIHWLTNGKFYSN